KFGRDGRLLSFDGFCFLVGITAMSRERYGESEDKEPCLLTPEDDPAMLDTPEDEPVGPEWWEGRWPAGGIASLEDLERWVDAQLDEMICLNWTHPRLGNIARMIGRQAVRNATRYLDRRGPGNHPPQPIADQLEQIEAALGAIQRHLRQGPDKGVALRTNPETVGKTRDSRKSRAVPKRSWLQDDLDEEIRKYKAHRANIYKELVERVREGNPGAIMAATRSGQGVRLCFWFLAGDVWPGGLSGPDTRRPRDFVMRVLKVLRDLVSVLTDHNQ